jgi:hypothetical protein
LGNGQRIQPTVNAATSEKQATNTICNRLPNSDGATAYPHDSFIPAKFRFWPFAFC